MTISKFLCKFGLHVYEHFQDIFVTHTKFEDEYRVIIAYKICIHCAKSKLIHILR